MTDVSSIAPLPSANVQTGVPTVSDGSIVMLTTSPSLPAPVPLTDSTEVVEVGAVMSYVNDSEVCAVAALPAVSLTATEKEWLASDSALRPADVITAVQVFEVRVQV